MHACMEAPSYENILFQVAAVLFLLGANNVSIVIYRSKIASFLYTYVSLFNGAAHIK